MQTTQLYDFIWDIISNIPAKWTSRDFVAKSRRRDNIDRHRIRRDSGLSQTARVNSTPHREVWDWGQRGSTQSTKSYGRVVSLAQSLIRQHEGRIRIAELAKLVHVTPRTLQLGFRNILDKRPKEVIIDYRLNRAKELLATTDRPIAEIADIAGFSVASDLYHRFSERYGLSPTEYRRKPLNG